MNDSPKSPATNHEGVREPLVGGDVRLAVPGGQGRSSDRVEAMEALRRKRL